MVGDLSIRKHKPFSARPRIRRPRPAQFQKIPPQTKNSPRDFLLPFQLTINANIFCVSFHCKTFYWRLYCLLHMNSDDKNLEGKKAVEYALEPESSGTIDKNNKNVNNEDIEIVSEEETGAESLKKLREKLVLCVKEKQNYLDKWQRSTADFMNARKRDAEDNERFRKFAAENLIAELLPVLESFNVAFSNKEAWEQVPNNWRTGVEYIANQLKGVLEANGLKELNPLGEKFDPMAHEAIEFVEVSNESENQKIIAVTQKGYGFYDRILKAPKVKVAETRIDADRTQTGVEKEK